MSDVINNEIYDKLTPQRKQLVDAVLKNPEKQRGLWRRGEDRIKPVFECLFQMVVQRLFICGILRGILPAAMQLAS